MRRIGILRMLNQVGGIIERLDYSADGVLFRKDAVEGERDLPVGSVVSYEQTMATNGRHLAKGVRLVKARGTNR